MRNIENFGDSNKVWWTNKGFLAKANSNTPDKEQTVFVLIHQKIGIVCEATLYKKYGNGIKQNKEMGNMRSVGT